MQIVLHTSEGKIRAMQFFVEQCYDSEILEICTSMFPGTCSLKVCVSNSKSYEYVDM